MFNTSSTSLEINNMHGTNNLNAVHKNQILKPNINHVYDNNDINDKIQEFHKSSNNIGKIALLVRVRNDKHNDNIETFLKSLYTTLKCDLKHFRIIILFGFDEIAQPMFGNKKYQHYVKKQLFQSLKNKLLQKYNNAGNRGSIQENYRNNVNNIEIKFLSYKSSNPCYIWNHLARKAYEFEHADYFYQLNSDNVILSKCTLAKLSNVLVSKDLIPNFGVAAAFDPQYKHVITKAFFSRMHMDIFQGRFLPIPPSKSWCSDQEYYLSHVYGRKHTFVKHSLIVTSNKGYRRGNKFRIEDQMTLSITQMSHEHAKWLFKEIQFGRNTIRKYIKSKFEK